MVRFWGVVKRAPPGFADSLNVNLRERSQEKLQGFEHKQREEAAKYIESLCGCETL